MTYPKRAIKKAKIVPVPYRKLYFIKMSASKYFPNIYVVMSNDRSHHVLVTFRIIVKAMIFRSTMDF